jgi:hypothetical protein
VLGRESKKGKNGNVVTGGQSQTAIGTSYFKCTFRFTGSILNSTRWRRCGKSQKHWKNEVMVMGIRHFPLLYAPSQIEIAPK